MAKDNKTLHLVLKRKWWDMIASGEKKEEYRDFSSFYIKRLCDNPCFDKDGRLIGREPINDYTISVCSRYGISLRDSIRVGKMIFKDFTYVCFHLGYTNVTMTFRIVSINVGVGFYKWCAELGKEYFVIKLGERIDNGKD